MIQLSYSQKFIIVLLILILAISANLIAQSPALQTKQGCLSAGMRAPREVKIEHSKIHQPILIQP
jgi:hypothetical protein